MILNYIVWNVDPNIFTLPQDWPLIGGFSVRWYGLLFAMSFAVGYIIMQRIFKNENIPNKVLDELTTYMIIFTIVGARLGHCLFYEPEYYLAHPLEILEVWKGGLASHGAAIGIITGLFFFSRKNKKPFNFNGFIRIFYPYRQPDEFGNFWRCYQLALGFYF